MWLIDTRLFIFWIQITFNDLFTLKSNIKFKVLHFTWNWSPLSDMNKTSILKTKILILYSIDPNYKVLLVYLWIS